MFSIYIDKFKSNPGANTSSTPGFSPGFLASCLIHDRFAKENAGPVFQQQLFQQQTPP